MGCLSSCFGALEDPRADNACYRLGDLLVMMIAASLCGATTATEFALFAEQRKGVLGRLIDYERAPSHDTFSRLLRLLDAQAFADAFARFAAGFARALAVHAGEADAAVVALDGKALRRAYEAGCAASPPFTVSAFAAQARLCLGVAAPGDRVNEIETALHVVQMIDLTHKIVTADALHCHHRMAAAIKAKGGDYVLALKGNRHGWLAAAKAAFNGNCLSAETRQHGHGRNEWRRAEVVATDTLMQGHKAFIRITAQRAKAKPVTRFYMASAVLPPEDALAITRAHWAVENRLHWMLDVHFGEDQSRARKDNAPANIAILTRLARNILQAADKPSVPISHRIKKCNWNDDYIISALAHMR